MSPKSMRCFAILFLVATVACSQKRDKIDSTIFLKGQVLAEVDSKLREISGLAASVQNKGMLWAHNDGGNDAEIFLIDQKMNIRLTCRLKGIVNRDWEDIAVGPGPVPGKFYVYVGDIGDNLEIFRYKRVYRFEEPIATPGNNVIIVSKFDTITIDLPDGAKDAEAMLIDPLSKDLYLISKNAQPACLYQTKYPYSPKDTVIAEKVTAIPFRKIVAADFSADGKEVIIKNYDNVYYWKMNGQPLGTVLKEKPYIVEYQKEPQGEAIAFSRTGSGFFTASEKTKGEKSYLYFYARSLTPRSSH
jgi:hypothetical protein